MVIFLERMTHPVSLLHPRKLHAMICACPTPEARARATLEFLRGSTQSEEGFLFLMRRGELVLAASSQPEPPAGLAEEAARAFQLQLVNSMEDQDTRTVELSELQAHNLLPENPVWTSASGDAYALRMLSTFYQERWVSAGLVMLKAKDPRTLVAIRHVHLQALCSALIESGDISESGENQASSSR
jgi:hypothetical protein